MFNQTYFRWREEIDLMNFVKIKRRKVGLIPLTGSHHRPKLILNTGGGKSTLAIKIFDLRGSQVRTSGKTGLNQSWIHVHKTDLSHFWIHRHKTDLKQFWLHIHKFGLSQSWIHIHKTGLYESWIHIHKFGLRQSLVHITPFPPLLNKFYLLFFTSVTK